jgi:two-component system, LytTR family, sensor kinase
MDRTPSGPSALPSDRQTFRLMLLLTVAMAAVFSVQSWLYGPVLGRPMGIATSLFDGGAATFLWLAATPLILALHRRWPLTRTALSRSIPVHSVSAAVLVGLYLVLVAWFPWLAESRAQPVSGFGNWLLSVALSSRTVVGAAMYLAPIAIAKSLDTVRDLEAKRSDAAQLEAELARARLRALESQLHPHFLFNALEAIRCLVDESPADARRTISMLGDLLRMTLSDADSPMISLSRELELVTLYLRIEEVRFGDRLRVALDVDPGVAEAVVPALVLQPLVENAVRHGIAPRREPGTILIAAHRREGELVLAVVNDGPPLARTARRGGIGLETTRRRLAHLYGGAARLSLADQPGGVRAEILLPQAHA